MSAMKMLALTVYMANLVRAVHRPISLHLETAQSHYLRYSNTTPDHDLDLYVQLLCGGGEHNTMALS